MPIMSRSSQSSRPSRSTITSRIRHELARRPSLHRSIVIGLVTVAAWATMSYTAGIDAERSRWGHTRPVLIATTDIEVGTPLADATAVVDHPVAVVPERALDPGVLDPATVARRHLPAGSTVTDADVGATSAPRTFLGEDEVAVTLTERIASGARPGDPVVVTTDGIVLAERATVVGVVDDRVIVAVDAAVAPMVAAAATGPAGVSLLLAP